MLQPDYRSSDARSRGVFFVPVKPNNDLWITL